MLGLVCHVDVLGKVGAAHHEARRRRQAQRNNHKHRLHGHM